MNQLTSSDLELIRESRTRYQGGDWELGFAFEVEEAQQGLLALLAAPPLRGWLRSRVSDDSPVNLEVDCDLFPAIEPPVIVVEGVGETDEGIVMPCRITAMPQKKMSLPGNNPFPATIDEVDRYRIVLQIAEGTLHWRFGVDSRSDLLEPVTKLMGLFREVARSVVRCSAPAAGYFGTEEIDEEVALIAQCDHPPPWPEFGLIYPTAHPMARFPGGGEFGEGYVLYDWQPRPD